MYLTLIKAHCARPLQIASPNYSYAAWDRVYLSLCLHLNKLNAGARPYQPATLSSGHQHRSTRWAIGNTLCRRIAIWYAASAKRYRRSKFAAVFMAHATDERQRLTRRICAEAQKTRQTPRKNCETKMPMDACAIHVNRSTINCNVRRWAWSKERKVWSG